jgi:hypothetical protein
MEYSGTMNRPSKKEIQAAVEKLKAKPTPKAGATENTTPSAPLTGKKSSIKIRKQGV